MEKPNKQDEIIDQISSEDVLTGILGNTIKRRRQDLGYSLEKLSKVSKVSRGMLGLIESGKTTPSIGILWKVALALRTPVSELIPDLFLKTPKLFSKENSKTVKFWKGAVEVRYLFRENFGKLGLYEVKIAPGRHMLPSIFLNQFDQTLIVIQGELEIEFRDRTLHASSGDSLFFLGSDLISFLNQSDEDVRLFWIESTAT